MQLEYFFFPSMVSHQISFLFHHYYKYCPEVCTNLFISSFGDYGFETVLRCLEFQWKVEEQVFVNSDVLFTTIFIPKLRTKWYGQRLRYNISFTHRFLLFHGSFFHFHGFPFLILLKNDSRGVNFMNAIILSIDCRKDKSKDMIFLVIQILNFLS